MKRVIKKVQNLRLKPQYAQRTPEWFLQRKTRITASEVASCLTYTEDVCNEYLKQFPHVSVKLNEKAINSYQSFEEYIIQKCTNVPFKDNVSTLHGKKYEDVACAMYTRVTNKDIYDFGLINHTRYKWLAASPDGITNDGVMLEIKCPNKRKIKENEVPFMYWIQMQIQMEVCNLDSCDFLECEIEDCSFDDWFYSIEDNKGIIGKYTDTDTPIYIYPPKHISDKAQFLIWKDSIETSLTYDVSFDYYMITKYQIISIKRSKIWFENIKPKLKKTHDIVTKYQNNPVLFQTFNQEFLDKKNKKFMDKFNSVNCSL